MSDEPTTNGANGANGTHDTGAHSDNPNAESTTANNNNTKDTSVSVEIVESHVTTLNPPNKPQSEHGSNRGEPIPFDAENETESTAEELEKKRDFKHSMGLSSNEAAQLLIIHGKNEIPEKSESSLLIFLRGCWGPMPIAIWIAVILLFALQNWPDGGILLVILFANATISWYETMKAGNAVAALKKSLRPTATVFRDGHWQNIEGTLVVPGDLVLLGSGSSVPADCILHEQELDIDESALTGESLPVTMREGDRPKMGSNVVRGEGHATVEFTGANTFFGRTAVLLSSVNTQLEGIRLLLVKIMFVLTTMSFVFCLIALLYLLFKINEPFEESLEFTVVLLVASIPIAIEIVVTTTLAMGSRQMAQFKAIVTRLGAIEALASMDMLCSDKTGTLTLNEMQIQDYCPIFKEGHDKESVLVLSALAAKWREPPRDALDRMVLGSAKLHECDKYHQLEYKPFDPVTKRTEATVRDSENKVFKVTKGAPHVVLKLCHNHAEIEDRIHNLIEELGATGTRCLTVAQTNDEGLWEMVGVLTFLDPPRPDTKRTIERAWENGIFVKMITGDHGTIAKEMARRLGLGPNIHSAEMLPAYSVSEPLPKDIGDKFGPQVLAADGFAQVFPEHKFMIVEILRKYGFTCGMTGDGVNDAPALKRADVGIAVSGATDAARAAADIVLTLPGLGVIIDAIVISRIVFNRIRSFMLYRISATMQLLFFFFISVFAFEPHEYQPRRFLPSDPANPNSPLTLQEIAGHWPDFFSIPVLMLMLITLLNDGTLLTIGYDNVAPSKRPQKWNLPALFFISAVLSSVSLFASLILLYGALTSYDEDGWFARWGLPPLEYGKITCLIYLQVSVAAFLTLFASRAVEGFFFQSKPHTVLLIGCVFSLSISTILASVWPEGETSGVPTMGLARGSYTMWPLWVWIYCICWWLFQDCCKVLAYKALIKYDWFQYRSLGKKLAFDGNKFSSGGQSQGSSDHVGPARGSRRMRRRSEAETAAALESLAAQLDPKRAPRRPSRIGEVETMV